ncbi:MAG: hypothetical protein M1820_001138 [Bogoriella megaspora]|nr:MAG: hypothetical protein M1820_001138 [Bogoriella megaspora]
MAQLSIARFTVGWICALSSELAAASALFDERISSDNVQEVATDKSVQSDTGEPTVSLRNDTNIYEFGRIGSHYIVAACLPQGLIGTNSASWVASNMLRSFPYISFGLLVGVAGGVPGPHQDVRLGDVVISTPVSGKVHGGVVQYDFGKTGKGGLQPCGSLDSPPTILLSAVSKLRAMEIGRLRSRIRDHMSSMERLHGFDFSPAATGLDVLYQATYEHTGGLACHEGCSSENSIQRQPRPSLAPIIHYGIIASGNQVIKDAGVRDTLSIGLGGVLCFEMEAAGLMNNDRCKFMVIRGICDYADSHKNKKWQPYAAAAASAYAKELLLTVPCISSGHPPVHSPSVFTAQPSSKQHFLVPYAENSLFVGREKILDQLHEFGESQFGTYQLRVAMYGLGGIGKSQIALQYAYRVRALLNMHVFWVRANTRENFHKSYVEIARECNAPGYTDSNANVYASVKAWLEEPNHRPWLMIVDNADDQKAFSGIFGESDSYTWEPPEFRLPISPRSMILLTTRNKMVAVDFTREHSKMITVGSMDETESYEFVTRKLMDPNTIYSTPTIAAFCDELHGLPLALDQATSYVMKNCISVEEYLDQLKSASRHGTELASFLQGEFRADGRDIGVPNAVASTWIISFEQIREEHSEAGELLSIMSFFDWHDIPQPLIMCRSLWLRLFVKNVEKQAQIARSGNGSGNASHFRKTLKRFVKQRTGAHAVVQKLMDESGKAGFRKKSLLLEHPKSSLGEEQRNKDRALGTLKAFSFVAANPENSVFHLHRLVQAVTRVWVANRNELSVWAGEALIMMAYFFPNDYSTENSLCLQLLMHAESVLKSVRNISASARNATDFLVEAILLHKVGNFLTFRGNWYAATQKLAEAVKIRQKYLGNDHDDTGESKNCLGIALRLQGRPKEAEELHKEVIKISEAQRGPDHYKTLRGKSELGLALVELGSRYEAIEILTAVLQARLYTLGAEHVETLTSISNLASVYYKQGSLDEAEELQNRVYRSQAKTLGRYNQHTLTSMNNLAHIWRDMGKVSEAIDLMRICIADQARTQDSNHPNTLNSQQALDEWQNEKNQSKGADHCAVGPPQDYTQEPSELIDRSGSLKGVYR